MGVEVMTGRQLHLMQYADDANAFLKSLDPHHVRQFVLHMHSFARASGQSLNLSKVQLMPIGQVDADAGLPTEIRLDLPGGDNQKL